MLTMEIFLIKEKLKSIKNMASVSLPTKKATVTRGIFEMIKLKDLEHFRLLKESM
jgi:hypothetical protein